MATYWMHRGEHVNGRWWRIFRGDNAALRSVAKHTGMPLDELRSGTGDIDDNGGRHRVSETTVSNTRTMKAIEDAYGARECGTATKRQLTLRRIGMALDEAEIAIDWQALFDAAQRAE
jgi:hypothetical protein